MCFQIRFDNVTISIGSLVICTTFGRASDIDQRA